MIPRLQPGFLSLWRAAGASKLRRLVFFLLALSLLLIALRLFSRTLTFFPSRETTPALATQAKASGLLPWLDKNGARIGWITPSGNPDAPILLLHGNAGMALDRNYLATILQTADPSNPRKIYLLEYPGYADRPGSPSQDAFIQAAAEALAELPSHAPPLVVGESIGSGVAALLAADHPELLSGLVLITPFTSLVAVGKIHYPWLPVRWLLADHFDSAHALSTYNGPVAFLVAERDEVTSARLGQALYEGYSGPKLLLIAPAAGHNEAAYVIPSSEWKRLLDHASSKEATEK